jgi:two-component system, LuxR family, sensor kinase FixL
MRGRSGGSVGIGGVAKSKSSQRSKRKENLRTSRGNQAGQIIGTVSITHDISGRRRAEQDRARLAAVMQNAAASIWFVSLDGTILEWNRGAERLLDYSAEEIVDKNISRIIPPDRPDDFHRIVQLLLDSRGAQEYETVRRHQDGSRVEVAMTESLFDSGGGVVGVCAVAHDVRERRRVEYQIAELAEGERQRIGTELHDSLGQEITAIGMIVSALREQLGENSPQAGSLDKLELLVNQSKTQVRSVAKGLLPVAVDASGLRIALGELAKEIKDLCGIDCRHECPEPIGTADSFVATQLYLIAREAAHNAARHSKARRIVIRLEDEEGLRLSIRDDGVGLDGARETETAKGMGVEIMRHRSSLIGATLRIESPREGGALVVCSVWNPQ